MSIVLTHHYSPLAWPPLVTTIPRVSPSKASRAVSLRLMESSLCRTVSRACVELLDSSPSPETLVRATV